MENGGFSEVVEAFVASIWNLCSEVFAAWMVGACMLHRDDVDPRLVGYRPLCLQFAVRAQQWRLLTLVSLVGYEFMCTQSSTYSITKLI